VASAGGKSIANRTTGIEDNVVLMPPKLPVCSATAAVPHFEPMRNWRLSVAWKRSCEEKNYEMEYPFGRNFCWIGLKKKCHANLKAHYSWVQLQQMAAEDGVTPPGSQFFPLEQPDVCDQSIFGMSRNWTETDRSRARDWFENHVKIYVLNLPQYKERWKMISTRLRSLQMGVTRVRGVDMRKPGALQHAKKAGWVPHGFNFTRAQVNAYTWKHQMGSILGTLGCATAHFKAQQKILADGSPLAVVLEDDSWLEDDFVERLWSLVHEELPCDWEVVSLMSRCPYGLCISQHLARIQPDANEPAWGCHHGVNWGMHGVLYRTDTLARVQAKWQHTVFNEERPRCMDVDVALASISDEVAFYAVPSVQDPGFLRERDYGSVRWDINNAATTLSTTTTRTTSTTIDTTKTIMNTTTVASTASPSGHPPAAGAYIDLPAAG